MNISNGLYKEVEINWQAITLPLKAGTPIGASGIIANNGSAVGLIPQTITKRPLMPNVYILVAGEVDSAEVNAESGMTISNDAKKALSAIIFRAGNGQPTPPVVHDASDLAYASKTKVGVVLIGNGLSISGPVVAVQAKANGGIKVSGNNGVELEAAKANALGGVKQAANVAVAAGDAPTKAEFDALISALITAGIMAAPASEG